MLCRDCGGYDRCGHCLTEVGSIGPWRERVSRLAKLLGEARVFLVTLRDSDEFDDWDDHVDLSEALADIDAALSGLAEKEVGDV